MNLLLEGDDLEALLLRAHREGGTSARIVRAEKVRRGGVLGFFAREGFEVAVEIPKDAERAAEPDAASDTPGVAPVAEPMAGSTAELASTRPPPGAAARPPTSLLELAERTSAAERAASRAIALQAAYASTTAPSPAAVWPAETTAAMAALVASPTEPPRATEPPSPAELPLPHDYGALDDLPPPARVTFAPIEFPKVEFPEDRPWPGMADALGSEWSSDPLTLNDADYATDVPTVTDLSARYEAATGEIPAATSRASDAELWFNTDPALPPAPRLDVDSVGTGSPRPQFTQLIDHLRVGVGLGRHRSDGSRPPLELTVHEEAPIDEDQLMDEDEFIDEGPQGEADHPVSEDHVIEANHSIKADYSVQVGFRSSPPAQPAEAVAPLGAHTMELSMSGGIPPAGTGSARATTVVPRRKPRRGSSNRALPVPRPAPHDERDGERDDESAPWIDAADEPISPDASSHPIEHGEPSPYAETETEAETAPAGARTSSDAAWRLLRGWRPGGRRRSSPEDEARLSVPEQDGVATVDEASDTRPDGATSATPFTQAATQGAVPAASAVIGSIDQLATDREALRALGVPAAWTRHLDEGDRFTSIVSMLGRLAELKISDDVAVIAVIGPADVVELEAHRTALDLPVEGRPRAVAVIPAEAGIERRNAIARSKRIRPVVVSIPIEGYDDAAGTRKILTSVHAEAVIAVIDARRPLEEITRWVESLERVDAIALDGALDVESPAAVLGLDVPVIRVDGIAVDRIGWAALLCAQLSATASSR